MPPSHCGPRDTVPSAPPDFDELQPPCRSPSIFPSGVPAMNADKTYDDYDGLVFTLDAEELDEL